MKLPVVYKNKPMRSARGTSAAKPRFKINTHSVG